MPCLALRGLEAVHDRGGLIGLVLGHQGGQQRLALLCGIGKAAGFVLVEAALDELGHERVGATLRILMSPSRKPSSRRALIAFPAMVLSSKVLTIVVSVVIAVSPSEIGCVV